MMDGTFSHNWPRRSSPVLGLLVMAFSAMFIFSPAAQSQADERHPEVVKNLKQLHAAFEAYRKDHDGRYPLLEIKNEDGSVTRWTQMLKPYLNDNSPRGRVDILLSNRFRRRRSVVLDEGILFVPVLVQEFLGVEIVAWVMDDVGKPGDVSVGKQGGQRELRHRR